MEPFNCDYYKIVMSKITETNFIFSTPPPLTGLYFQIGDTVYLPNSIVDITDIGSQPADFSNPGSTLICVTINVNTRCCRQTDGRDTGNWRFANHTIIPQHSMMNREEPFETYWIYNK